MSTKIFKKEIYLIAYNIRSLYNVGSLFRSADAFGVTKIYLCGITGGPMASRFEMQIAKTALGAQKNIPWQKCRRTLSLIKKLKKEGVKIIALETGKESLPLHNLKPEFPLALVIGNEVSGISKNILKEADKIVTIKMRGKKESLNVSVACGIALFYLKQL
ncbi:TrmH family RNA methyltransferase [Candidatus Parcubacteria bacterium]|nr:MAG: TrmH family RNA methyltransferase [Candidatus Parcubacteria bacterium]